MPYLLAIIRAENSAAPVLRISQCLAPKNKIRRIEITAGGPGSLFPRRDLVGMRSYISNLETHAHFRLSSRAACTKKLLWRHACRQSQALPFRQKAEHKYAVLQPDGLLASSSLFDSSSHSAINSLSFISSFTGMHFLSFPTTMLLHLDHCMVCMQILYIACNLLTVSWAIHSTLLLMHWSHCLSKCWYHMLRQMGQPGNAHLTRNLWASRTQDMLFTLMQINFKLISACLTKLPLSFQTANRIPMNNDTIALERGLRGMGKGKDMLIAWDTKEQRV